MISHANQEFNYEADVVSYASEFDLDTPKVKQDYSRKRPAQPARRRKARRANQPGCGIGARRNKRYAW